MSQKPSSSLRLDGQNDANGDSGPLSADEDVVHPELSREHFTGTQAVFLKANQEPAKGFQVTTSAGGHSLKKRCAPLDDIDHEKVTQKCKLPCRYINAHFSSRIPLPTRI